MVTAKPVVKNKFWVLQPKPQMVVSAVFCRLGTDTLAPSQCHERGHLTKPRLGAEGSGSWDARGVVIRKGYASHGSYIGIRMVMAAREKIRWA